MEGFTMKVSELIIELGKVNGDEDARTVVGKILNPGKTSNIWVDEDREIVSISNVYCKASTDKAILCIINGRDYWFPHTQVNEDSEVYEKGGTGTLVVSKWIAEQKELIDEF